MKDKYYSKKVTVNNYNHRGGDTHFHVGSFAVVLILAVFAFMYLLYQGILKVLYGVQYVVEDISSTFREINTTISDPEIKGYFTAIFILFFVVLLGCVYLYHRFKIGTLISNFFNHEEDVDFL